VRSAGGVRGRARWRPAGVQQLVVARAPARRPSILHVQNPAFCTRLRFEAGDGRVAAVKGCRRWAGGAAGGVCSVVVCVCGGVVLVGHAGEVPACSVPCPRSERFTMLRTVRDSERARATEEVAKCHGGTGVLCGGMPGMAKRKKHVARVVCSVCVAEKKVEKCIGKEASQAGATGRNGGVCVEGVVGGRMQSNAEKAGQAEGVSGSSRWCESRLCRYVWHRAMRSQTLCQWAWGTKLARVYDARAYAQRAGVRQRPTRGG